MTQNGKLKNTRHGMDMSIFATPVSKRRSCVGAHADYVHCLLLKNVRFEKQVMKVVNCCYRPSLTHILIQFLIHCPNQTRKWIGWTMIHLCKNGKRTTNTSAEKTMGNLASKHLLFLKCMKAILTLPSTVAIVVHEMLDEVPILEYPPNSPLQATRQGQVLRIHWWTWQCCWMILGWGSSMIWTNQRRLKKTEKKKILNWFFLKEPHSVLQP